MRWPWRPRFRIQPQLLPEELWQTLRSDIVSSPWLAGTTLNHRFAATWGFSVAFRRDGLGLVRKNFSSYMPYLEKVLESDCNAFFLNPLVIFRGGQVMPHIDCSLRSYTAPMEPPYPVKVSVFYAQVPPQLEGGTLVLTDGRGKTIGRVQPEGNLLVQFEGDLMHHVEPFHGSDEADLSRSRISLVCEHYRLGPTLLTRIPAFHLESTRQFEEFLQKELETSERGNEA